MRATRSVRDVETVFDAHVDPPGRTFAAASTFGSMWLDIRTGYPKQPDRDHLRPVVIAGHTPAVAALHARQRNPNRRMLLIDANRIGWAASGARRLRRRQPDTRMENGKARWPNEIDTLEAMGVQNLDGMQADIESLGLDVEWQRTGMLSVATNTSSRLARRRAGQAEDFLGLSEVRDEVHSPTYLAGLTTQTRLRSCIRQAGVRTARAAETPVCRSMSTPTRNASNP